MPESFGPARPRTFLRVERLEDRSTPTATPTDRLLVTFDAGPDADRLAALSHLPAADGVSSLGLGIYRVNLRAGADLAAAATAAAALPGVRAAEPDRLLHADATLNDPSLGSQTALAAVGAAAAWTRSTGTGQTIVAVIDTGIDYTHPDLAANIWHNPGEIAGNGRDDDGDGYVDDAIGYDFADNTPDPMDADSHGTHVAGIIGAVGNNGVGISGVDPNVRLMALKFIGASGDGYTSDAVRAVAYAVAHGAKVINASWGGSPYDPTLAAALAQARTAGVIVVAAAGNTGTDTDTAPFYPAGYGTALDNVVSVAATDDAGNLASYSNYGAASVTLGAPGNNVLSTLPGDRYGQLSGTSMAAPMVAGAVALLWDANPGLSYQQVIAKLKASVDPTASLAGKTASGGRLDVAKLLDATSPPPASPPAVPPSPPITPTSSGARVTSAVFGGTATNTFDAVRLSFDKKINAGSFTPVDISLSGPTGAIAVASVTPVAGTNNQQFDVRFGKQAAAGTYTVVVGVDVFDIAGDRLNQNGTAPNGEAADRFTGTGTLVATDVTSASGGNLPDPIPDGGTVEIPLVVTKTGVVAGVTLTLTLEHEQVGDLVLKLRSPDGTTITLADRRGGTGSGFRGTTFDDTAKTLISKAKSPFAGAFRPEQSFAGLRGRSAAGTWTLIVTDTKAGHTGTVRAVKLDLATTAPGTAAVPTPDPVKSFAPVVETKPATTITPVAATPAVVVARQPMLLVSPTTVTLAEPAAEVRPETRLLLGGEPVPVTAEKPQAVEAVSPKVRAMTPVVEPREEFELFEGIE